MSRRVVVTGYGIVSSIGNDRGEVLGSLREGRSGIEFSQEYADLGFRSQVHGPVRLDPDSLIERKARRFMGDAACFAYLAMREAIVHAGLGEQDVRHPRTGLVAGSGGSSTANIVAAADTLRSKGLRKVSAFGVPRSMSSTTSACLSTSYGIKGVSYSISSACATSAHCIGHGAELIQLGKQDVVFAGGGEEVHWTQTLLFDAMGALSAHYNATPTRASRPYDADRDGFVISGGGGIVVLEELEHALARGAPILAELVGYGASSDGFDMVQPSGEGAVRCMRQALERFEGEIHYINAHGTSTPVGDIRELEAMREVFGSRVPPVSSTKSLTGHALGAAGVHEAIYCLLMMEHGFIAASANIDHLDPGAEGIPLVLQRSDGVRLDAVMSNSFGFGGTNASLVFRRYDR